MNKLTIIILFLFPASAFAQTKYPKDYFRPPMDITLKAAAYFGDVRTNHFHSGLDLRTEQVEGKKVFAVADGYVSRIRVSATGFGYALYITHPNGYTSLYGHLQKYNQQIWDYIVAKQYEKESFEIDLNISPEDLPVKKGDLIAFSGNSGGSEGPHLHFEIRNTKTEKIINPLLCGFEIPDHIPPQIKKIVFYVKQKYGWKEVHDYKLSGSNGKYFITENIPLHFYGELGIGIESSDMDDVSGMPNGFYSLVISGDKKTYFKQEMDQFSFSETRYINASIDYEKKQKLHQSTQCCFLLPNNLMTVFDKDIGSGTISISDTSLHIVDVTVKDVKGNSASVKLFIKGDPVYKIPEDALPLYSAVFPSGQKNVFENSAIKVEIPKGLIYDTLYFQYSSSSPGAVKFLSDIHHVHNPNTPVHSYYTVSIKSRVPEKFASKALIVSVGDNNVVWAEGGKYENGFVKADVRSFGNFAVMIDTTAPRATFLNLRQGANVSSLLSIRVKISDNLSGIKSYRGTIDGQWILMELDGKTSVLSYYFDKPLEKGKHKIRVTVTDRTGNTGFSEVDFVK